MAEETENVEEKGLKESGENKALINYIKVE